MLTFVIVAAVLFFLVITPVNALMTARKIPLAARRCAFCTTEVAPV